MAWRLARSLEKLRSQINALSPNRSKASDGTVGDTAHSARKSDHNPDAGGVVRAMDITHDPAHGIDSEKLANAVLASRDQRVKYVISNRKIASGAAGPQPWKWRPYKGSNPHNKHVHVSVVAGAKGDDGSAWAIDLKVPAGAVGKPKAAERPVLKLKSKGPEVERLQTLLGIEPDGDFGPATKKAVIAFQKANKLVPDGAVGPYTWDALERTVKPQPAPVKPADPEKASPTKPAMMPPAITDKVTVEVVQRKLKDLNYQVGGIDGIIGTMTKEAILAFRMDNGLPLTPEIDQRLLVALDGAKPRELVPARENADDATVRGKVPEVRSNWFTKVIAFVVGIPAAIAGAFDGILGNIGAAKDYVAPVQEFAGDVPGWAWLLIVAAIAGGIFVVSRHGEQKGAEAFRTGARR